MAIFQIIAPLLLSISPAQTSPIASQSPIHYTVTAVPGSNDFDVSIRVTAAGKTTSFHIPAWTPGYYHIEHFQDSIRVTGASEVNKTALTLDHPNSRTWTVATSTGEPINFSYVVHATDPGLGFFGSMLNNRVGFINGASALMYIDGQMTNPDYLKVVMPTGWKEASTLDQNKLGEFVATTGYDELIDSPLQLGDFIEKSFTVRGVPYNVIFVSKDGTYKCNPTIVARRIKIVSAPALDMFKSHSFSHYTYFLHLAVGDFSGGLEHRAGTCIAIDDAPEFDIDSIVAHENFHAWNVKQIRPFVLGPFDYTQPDRTGALWFMEGVTDYYADVLTYRSGLKSKDWLLGTLAEQISELQSSKDRSNFTLEECSEKCWDSDGFSYGDLSYYTKGLVCGLIFDASIRNHTHGKKSLDDVMRYLYATYHLPNPGFGPDGLLDAMNKVVGEPNCFDNLYATLIRSTKEVPYSILRGIGLEMVSPENPQISRDFTIDSGVVTDAGAQSQASGLLPGDKVISLDDSPWDGVSDQPTDQFVIQVERDGVQRTIKIPYTYDSTQSLWLKIDPNAGDASKALLEQWLNRPDPSKTDD